MEVLPTSDMLPTHFQPIASWRFILDVPGLDAFLVKRIERPPYIKPDESWSKTDRERLLETRAHQKLVIFLHDPIAPSGHQQVLSLIESVFKTNIKLLDPVGTVIGGTTYHGCQVERIDYSPLDYGSKEHSEIKLTLSYNNEKPYGWDAK